MAFPTSIYSPRAKANKSGVVYDAGKQTVGFVEDITKLDDEVVGIETLFGINDDAQTVPTAGAVLKGKAAGKSKWSTEIFIDTDGKVGIGIVAPGRKFDVVDNVAGIAYPLRIRNIDATGGTITHVGFEFWLREHIGATQHLHSKIVSISEQEWINDALTRDSSLAFSTSLNGSVAEKMRIDSNGNVGIGTDSPTAKLDVDSNILRLRTAKTPASAGASGNAGDVCWDASYIYVCVATNTWKRVAISTW